MSVSDSERTCPSCGKPLAAGAPLGLCPECLIKSGFLTGTEPGTSGAGDSGFVPPAVEDIRGLFPQFEVLELIGKGGMGAVYKARQPLLNRPVALKILARGKETDARFAERFRREAEALAKMNHPNIVTVYDFGQNGGLYYLIMEYVEGVNLRQLERTRKITPEEALAIVPPICEALQYAHQQGIVHRDIKPENILLGKQGQVKIADFGIAKILGAGPGQPLTGERQTVGTPHYMAPEQVEKPTTVDHRADIYSLGVVFYEMLTGELPLGRFDAPSKKVQVDVRLDEIVLRALEKEPERRYQQASQFKTQVETITGARTVPPPRRALKPALVVAGVIGAVIGILGVVALTNSWSSSGTSEGMTVPMEQTMPATSQASGESAKAYEEVIKSYNESAKLSPAPKGDSSNAAFGPVMERVLQDADEMPGYEALDLRNGKFLSFPRHAPADWDWLPPWLETNRVDLIAGRADNRWYLMCVKTKLCDFDTEGWTKATPTDAAAALQSATSLQQLEDDNVDEATTKAGAVVYRLPPPTQLPRSFAFQTREGVQGLLQLTGFTEEPRGLSIRYKLVQGTPATPAGAQIPASESTVAVRDKQSFAVQGRVTDEQGNGLPGVTVFANCGEGTLRRTGTTETDAKGRYVLSFGPGMRMVDETTGKWVVGFQAATIGSAKSGYVDANLHRQGDLLMADRLPAPGEDVGWKLDTNKLVLPGRPYELNFVMLPSASIEGQLHDQTGAALAGWGVCLGGDELPPSSSVFECADSDEQGHFSLKDVPTTGRWWLVAYTHGEPERKTGPGPEFRSEKFNLAEPGKHEFDAQLDQADAAHELKIRQTPPEKAGAPGPNSKKQPTTASVAPVLTGTNWDKSLPQMPAGTAIEVEGFLAEVPSDFLLTPENMDRTRLAAQKDVQILAAPHITTHSGEEAEIRLEQSAVAASALPPGIRLKVLPTLDRDRVVYQIKVSYTGSPAQTPGGTQDLSLAGITATNSPALFEWGKTKNGRRVVGAVVFKLPAAASKRDGSK